MNTDPITDVVDESWHTVLHTVRELYVDLRRRGELNTIDEIDYFWEKPQKRRAELERMLREPVDLDTAA